MRALVTGCAGFIGSHLTESLLADDQAVLGVDCFNDNYGRPQKLRNLERAQSWDAFEFVPIDLSRGDLDDLVDEVDVIYHLAAEPGVRASWGRRFELYLRNNVSATQLLLEAAKRRPEKRFVYASSSSIYGEAETLPTHESAIPAPYSPYGMTKLSGEHLCRVYHGNYGVDVVILRYFSVYGPRQRPDMAFNIFCRSAIAGRPLEIYGDGRQTRDFTFVGDVVQAMRDAARSEWCGVANVGGGTRTSLNGVLDIVRDLCGEVRVIHRPPATGDVRHTAADISVAAAAFGYRPRTSLREGLAAMVAAERLPEGAMR
jgi:nucleoside-diphosphate-sugar epimerase